MYQILPMNTLIPFILETLAIFSILSIIGYCIESKTSKNEEMKKSKNIKQIKTIMSLFVSFDPKSSVTLLTSEMNWIIMLLILSFLFLSFWSKPSRLSIFVSKSISEISNQFEIALKTKNDSSKILFTSIFLFIVLSNLSGLIPNSFTSSSHMTVNLFISVPFWLGFFLFGWFTFTNKMLAHLVPNGTPSPLISFMVLIELISTSIRPFTLSIRLMANMVSGHLLLTLLGNTMVNLSIILIFLTVGAQTMLSMLELGVCMIQAYVFCMLLTLYSDESDYNK